MHRSNRYESSSWIVPIPMRAGSNPISDLRMASCYISISAHRKTNRSIYPIWRQVEIIIQSESLVRMSLLLVLSYVDGGLDGGGCSVAIPSLVLRLLRSVKVFVGSGSSTFSMALAAVEDGRKNWGLFRRIFVLCRSTIFGIVVCIAVARRMLDKFVLPFQAVAVVQVLKMHAGT